MPTSKLFCARGDLRASTLSCARAEPHARNRLPASYPQLAALCVVLCATSLACTPIDVFSDDDATASPATAAPAHDADVASSPPAADTGEDAAQAMDAQATKDAAPAADTGGRAEAVDAGPPGDAGDAGNHEPAPPCLAQGSGDYAMRGSYGVRRETVELPPDPKISSSDNTFTIFSPEPLDAACRHPFAVWANASALPDTDTYAFYQEHAASWGIVIIAAHDSNVGPDHHARAIDYLLAQNSEPGSRFYRKLSGRAGAGGHVQGASIASVFAANHPNVEAIVALSPNGLGEMGTRAFLCLSGTDDPGVENCRQAVSAASGPALEASWNGGDRIVTPTVKGFIDGNPGTLQLMRLYTAWYRCFLADDARACDLFRGGRACGICDEAGWAEIVSENL